jgi:hypothetical protein
MRARLLLAALTAVLAAAGGATALLARAHTLPAARRCPVLPRANPWNQRVDRLPVAANSGVLVRSIGASAHAHPDFGAGLYAGGPIGIPYDVVSRHTHRSRVSFTYAAESDRVGYPIPRGVHVEGGAHSTGDRHAILVDRDSCRLFELYDLHRTAHGWRAGSGATWNLRSNHLRPAGHTSADAAGLPILPGLARADELRRRGGIDHALRFTAPRTRTAFVYPARHQAGESGSRALPPMGTRIRLKVGVSYRGFGPQARAVIHALKRYGAILADNGSPWYFSGAPDRRWNNDDLHALGRLSGRDFEVVDTRRLPHPR